MLIPLHLLNQNSSIVQAIATFFSGVIAAPISFPSCSYIHSGIPICMLSLKTTQKETDFFCLFRYFLILVLSEMFPEFFTYPLSIQMINLYFIAVHLAVRLPLQERESGHSNSPIRHGLHDAGHKGTATERREFSIFVPQTKALQKTTAYLISFIFLIFHSCADKSFK